ncbi:MAG TPA: hypothetical protein ENF45_05365 [Bacteroidetes bacterium]|nr:hypothetical protein [Bacteroidota bacterium]
MSSQVKLKTKLLFCIPFFLLVLITTTPSPLLAKDKLRVIFLETQQLEVSLPLHHWNNSDYVPLRQLADLLKCRTYYNSFARKIVLYMGNHRIKITALNPFVVVDELIFQLPVNTNYDDSGIWVPIPSFLELIENYYSGHFEYNPEQETLFIHREGINISQIIVEEKINGTLIRIQTLRKFELPNVATRLSHRWLYVDIYGGRLDTTQVRSNQRIGIVKKIVPLQLEEMTQLSFQLAQDIEKSAISVTNTDHEILVSLRTRHSVPHDLLLDLQKEKKKWLIDKIVIDPGHGGKDPGAIGPSGLYEKDVVLDIAKRLKKLLKKKLHVKVLMTREKDIFVGLRERSAFANRNGAKLFISLHTNANRNRRVKGFSTYCLGVARSDEDREIAQRENAVIKYEDSWAEYGDINTESFILQAIAQNSFNRESQELAALIQKNVKRYLKIEDRGVLQAGFLVLVGTAMPKILVEVGFISNREEERKLRTRSYRQKIAEVIFNSIKEFKERYEEGIVTEAASK